MFENIPLRQLALEKAICDAAVFELGPGVFVSLLERYAEKSRDSLPMTIIAAVRESADSILVGADSGQTELITGLRTRVQKLERHPTMILAWGVSGVSSVAESFGKALKRHSIGTWDSIESAAVEQLQKANKKHLKLAEESAHADHYKMLMAHLQKFASFGSHALVAGYLEGELRGFTVDDLGQLVKFKDGITSIGGAAKEVEVSYNAVCKIQSNVSARSFRYILEAVADGVQGCDPPVHVLRISRRGIVRLSRKSR